MAIIQMPRTPGLGELFGTGLSSGIQNIVNMKLNTLAQREQRKGTISALQGLGYSPDDATMLSGLDPKTLQAVVKEKMQAPSQRLFEQVLSGQTPGLESQLGVRPGMGPEEIPMATQAVLPQQAELPPTERRVPQLESPLPEPRKEKLKPIRKGELPRDKAIAIQQPKFPSAIPTIERQIQPVGKISPITRQISKLGNDISRMGAAISSGGLKPKQTEQVAKIMAKKEEALSKLLISEEKIKKEERKFDVKQKLEERKFKFEEKKFEKQLSSQEKKVKRDEQKSIDKETLPTYKKITTDARAAHEGDMRLGRIEELNEKGNLGFTLFNSLISTIKKGVFGFGIDLNSLMTDDAQELDKLSRDFLKNVKDIFGARVTQQEVQMYLKTIPNLYQSRGGRRRVIGNLRAFNKIAKIRFNTMNDIVNENNGRRPRNLSSLIEKRISSKLDTVSKRFKSAPTRRYKPIIPILGI